MWKNVKRMGQVVGVGCLLVAAVQAKESARPIPAQQDWKISAGVMAVGHSERFYTDQGNASFSGFPLVAVEYKNLYWKGSEIGYSRQVTPTIKLTPFFEFRGGLGLAGDPSGFGGPYVDASDMADGYNGIDDRRHQVEAGLKADVRLPYKHRLELEGRWGERGGSAQVVLKRGFMARNFKWAVFPFVGGRVMSSELADYYVGVSEQEAADIKSYRIDRAYRPGRVGLAGSVGISGFVGLGERWKMIAAVEGQVVSDAIMDSPLVRNRTVLSAVSGIVYAF